ncbi:hypothetical protein ACLOJK_036871 [Asimina triloba]
MVLAESDYAPARFERRSSALGKMTVVGRLGVYLCVVEPDRNSLPRCHSFSWLRSSDRCVAGGDLHCSHVKQDAPAWIMKRWSATNEDDGDG